MSLFMWHVLAIVLSFMASGAAVVVAITVAKTGATRALFISSVAGLFAHGMVHINAIRVEHHVEMMHAATTAQWQPDYYCAHSATGKITKGPCE